VGLVPRGDANGWPVGASFPAITDFWPVTCTTTSISGGTLTSLVGLLPAGDTVLSGWSLAATSGYTAGDPVYLSFNVGHAQLLDDLKIWQYGGSSWTSYAATDLTYDQTYASLTFTALGTYAVTGDLVLAGDANRDGTTNGADLNTVLSNFNKTAATWATGDFDGNATVNGADLNTVLSNFNRSLGVSSVGVALPEPCALVMLLAGLFGVVAYGLRKRS
jgi:hypothetical protein